MDHVECRNEIEARCGQTRAIDHFEANTVVYTSCLSICSRAFDGAGMRVVAMNSGFRKCGCDSDCGAPAAAADVQDLAAVVQALDYLGIAGNHLRSRL